jgi:hypothetical protein
VAFHRVNLWSEAVDLVGSFGDRLRDLHAQRSRLRRAINRLPSVVAFCYHPDNSRSTKEREMRRAFMSIQKGIASYVEDMTLNENVELGDFGACRRR